ncbi:MAG: helix-turn-helix transcriptional regulator [Bacteroidetes bacterium]|nr:helix-turn-helix transcriptional regulator [Bacteroidota bacterium]
MRKEEKMDELPRFNLLDNDIVGRNLYKIRKIREKKIGEVAQFVGMGEAAYTKYERGETKITIDLIRKLGEFYKIDPLLLLSSVASHLFENNNGASFVRTNIDPDMNVDLTQKILQLMETVLRLDERIITMKENKEI